MRIKKRKQVDVFHCTFWHKLEELDKSVFKLLWFDMTHTNNIWMADYIISSLYYEYSNEN